MYYSESAIRRLERPAGDPVCATLTGMSETYHAHVVARGRVQGVFYRDTMRRSAIARGVNGSAVNRPDGTVECHFEGPRAAVEAMVEVARAGSSASQVTQLDVEWMAPTGATSFKTG